MAQYSGIYLNLEGTTAEINSLQQPRETAWDTTSGMFRYMDAASGIHYFGGESLWTAYGPSGIYYKVGNDDQVFFGHPEDSYISIESWLVSGAFTLGSNANVTVCGSWWEHRDDDFKIYSVKSGLFRIYDGNNLSFEDPDHPTNPKWFLKTSGNNFYIKNGDYNYADLTISSDYRLYLETWSGDMFLRTFNGGNIILEATGDVYSSGWQNYNATASGWGPGYTASVQYKTLGDLVFINYAVNGSGNGDYTKISIPFPAATSGFAHRPVAGFRIGDSYDLTSVGAFVSGSWVNVASGAFWPSPGNYYQVWGSGVAASSLKWVCGHFWYQRA